MEPPRSGARPDQPLTRAQSRGNALRCPRLISLQPTKLLLCWIAPRNRGKVKDDRVIPSLCGRHSPWKGVSIICVEKNGDIDLLTQNSHERRDVTNSHKQFAVMR